MTATLQTTSTASMNRLNKDDVTFMRRAIQLARLGEGNVSPNPMVGAVVVAPGGRIIGEGYHRKYGEAHAEVNAIASVAQRDRKLLRDSTIYVTLEPCSHYGKTPPCAKLIIDTGLRRVVVGSLDPFPQVSGRGIKMIEEAGIETTIGVLREGCEQLNRRFMTAHRNGRPWVQLKWAESADGFLSTKDKAGNPAPAQLSTLVSRVWMHRQRSLADAIMVGTTTIISDNPSLTCRYWPGKNPKKITFQSYRTPPESLIARDSETIFLSPNAPLKPQLEHLYSERGITSLMVEGGAETLRSFMAEGLADEIRCEISHVMLKEHGATPSPLSYAKNT